MARKKKLAVETAEEMNENTNAEIVSTHETTETLETSDSNDVLELEFTETEIDIELEVEASDDYSDEEILPENLVTDETEILRALEAMVFASPKALSHKRIKSLLTSFSYDTRNLNELLQRLMNEYENRGFQFVKIAGSYQFRSHPTQSEVLQKLLEDKPVRLSPSALEVLAIISYKQPVSRAEIDVVRGVDSGHLTRGLLDKNLIRTVGHADTPGRPLLYATTPQFLEIFSLDSLDDLPNLEEFDRELANSSTNEGAESDDAESVNFADADAASLEEAALFHDHASPLAANPDRGAYDEPTEDEEEKPDFGVSERALEETN